MKLFVVLCYLLSSKGSDVISRDGRLDALTDLLSSPASMELFKSWNGSESDTDAFLRLLDPMLLNEDITTIYTASVDQKKQYSIANHAVDCGNPLYNAVFNGKTLSGHRRMVVDFVLFGYDVDRLLIRLHETFDVVDVFVIYELPFTLTGKPKTLYWPTLLDQNRFAPFKEKVFYATPDIDEVSPLAKSVRDAVAEFMYKERSHSSLEKDTSAGRGGSFGQKGKSALVREFSDDLHALYVLLLIELCPGYLSMPWSSYLPSIGALDIFYHFLQYH